MIGDDVSRNFVGLCVSLVLTGCATINAQIPSKESEYYPKASPDANVIVTLQSNKEKTDFYIDEKWIAKGKIVKTLINGRPHIIKAKPEGCIAKEDYIQPPYNRGAIYGFYYLIEDMENAKRNEGEVIAVKVIGYSMGKKGTLKKDYEEAVVDAKLKAIERAGVEIKSKTVMEDFQLKSDFVENKSQGVIEPGYEILEVGYDENGVYKVLLTGHVRTTLN